MKTSEPGSLFEQTLAIALYLNDETRHYWPERAWQRARKRAIPHARKRKER